MWIRWLEWRSADDETERVRARTPTTADALDESVRDASDLEATLRYIATFARGRRGELVLEIVGAGEPERDALARLLDPLSGGNGSDLASYLVSDRVPPSAGEYRVQRGADGMEIEQVRGYRSLYTSRLLPPIPDDDTPLLYVIPVRIIAQDDRLLINWKAPGGYPRAPDSRRVSGAQESVRAQLGWPLNVIPRGPAENAREAGISEEVIAFEHGPLAGLLRQVGELQGPVAATPSAPRILAERMVAELASSLAYAAQECGEALTAWETDFLSLTEEDRPTGPIATPDSYRQLAAIASLLAPIRTWTDELNSPADHDPVHWFAPTPESTQAQQRLQSAEQRLDEAREDYRTALTVAAGIATSQQLELQARSQQRGQAFERIVALVGSIVLVPGLVATFYGANVPVPAGATWWGTALLAVSMVFAGCATWVLLNRLAPYRP
jgi:hypothetical protein